MDTYTADAVSLLVYLVDGLPRGADRVFAAAEAGEAVIQAPSTALAETLYAVSRGKNVRGVTLTATPEEARRALVEEGPVTVASIGSAELAEYGRLVDDFSIHDGLVVASHLAQNTTAILTSDGVITDTDYPVVWE